MKRFTVLGSGNTVIGTVAVVEEIRDEDVKDIGSLNKSAEAYGLYRTPGEHAMREMAVKAAKEKFGTFWCIGEEVQ